MKVLPLQNYVLIKEIEEEKTTPNGLLIPESVRGDKREGIIVEVHAMYVNDEGTIIEPTVKRGDKVLFGKYVGSEITIDNEEYVMIKESELLARLED